MRFTGEPTALEKYTDEQQLDLASLRDPSVFTHMADRYFARMDRDNSAGLSKLELYDSQEHSNSKIEREVARTLLKNFDSASGLASNKMATELRGSYVTGSAKGQYEAHFQDRIKTADISADDIRAINTVMIPEERRSLIARERQDEKDMAGMQLFFGAGAAGLALTTLELPPLAVGLGASAAALGGAAYNNYFRSSNKLFAAEVDKRYSAVKSWNYFTDVR